MEIDKFKFSKIIKGFVLITYIIYVAFFNTNFCHYLPIYNASDLNQKSNLRSEVCVVLMGGSNVRFGLSAEKIGSNSCKCINLGVSSEGGSFSNYSNWLIGKVKAKTFIYSPAIIWSENSFIEPEELNFTNIIPSVPLISQIKAGIRYSKISEHSFNSFGDQIKYSSNSVFVAKYINKRKFINANTFIVQEIIARLNNFKKGFDNQNVLIRIPPVFCDNENKELYKEIMGNRIKALKNAGVVFVGETIVSSDKSLFCNDLHPNEKGRDVFSNEIKSALKNLEIVNYQIN